MSHKLFGCFCIQCESSGNILKMKRIILKLTQIFLSIPILLFTVEAKGQATTQIGWTTKADHSLKSEINGKVYQLFVSLPDNYSSMDTLRYPVVYFLDGKQNFRLFQSIRGMLDNHGLIESIILIGISDSTSDFLQMSTSRRADFTPSYDARNDSLHTKNLIIPAVIPKSGGGQAFLSSIQKEIIPFIDRIYKTTDDRGLIGHSFGGLFVSYCLLESPDLFKRYGILSPSFWWNNKEMITRETKFSERNKVLSARVFLSVGSLEGESMVRSMTSFADSLKSRNYKDLILTTQIFENETHSSVIPASINRTLRVLYDIQKKYKKPLEFKAEDLDKYLGIYSSKEMPQKIIISKSDKILMAQATGQSAFALQAIQKDKFKFDQAGIILEFMPSEKQMILIQVGRSFTFTKE